MTIAIAIIAGVGLVAALALAIADKYLAVREDPRIGMVTAALPGANCGGCGFPGCDGYARALVAGTAAMTAGGDKGCTYGCLGYGACANVCPKGAISIHDGLAKVDKRLCIGCGKCVTACPKKIIELVPASATIHVLCANPDKGPNVRKVCGVGCMGCHLCEKNSGGKEAGHFTFQGFLAKVNYENPPTDEQIVAKCPAKCMSVDPHFETGR